MVQRIGTPSSSPSTSRMSPRMIMRCVYPRHARRLTSPSDRIARHECDRPEHRRRPTDPTPVFANPAEPHTYAVQSGNSTGARSARAMRPCGARRRRRRDARVHDAHLGTDELIGVQQVVGRPHRHDEAHQIGATDRTRVAQHRHERHEARSTADEHRRARRHATRTTRRSGPAPRARRRRGARRAGRSTPRRRRAARR